MIDATTMVQEERRRESVVDAIARDHGPEGLFVWLLTRAQEDADWTQTRRALRLLSQRRQDTWLKDIVKIAVEADAEDVRDRVRRWELTTVLHSLDETASAALILSLRAYLHGHDLDWAVRAARCLWAIGYRYEGAHDELSTLSSRLAEGGDDRATVVSAGADLGAFSESGLRSEILALVAESREYNKRLAFLIGRHGEAGDFPYLEEHFQAHGHDVLMAMLQMCLRVPEVRESTLRRFLDAGRRARSGLDHFAARVFDSPELVALYLNESFAAFVNNGSVLPELALVKSCVREAQLMALGEMGSSLSSIRTGVLESLVVEPSGHRGLMNSHSTFRKTAAIGLSSRLGLESLRAWLPKGMEGEVNRALMQRMAEDCSLLGVRDFVLPLGEVLKIEGDHATDDPDEVEDGGSEAVEPPPTDNPMWLVSDEAGVSGGEATLRVLLQSDGRHGMDQALMSYVEGLAFAAVNWGSTRLLTEAMLDGDQPSWRRGAAAHAVRTAALYAPAPETDWPAAERFASDPSEDKFARHELLVALAEHDAEAAGRVISGLPAGERPESQVLLAQGIARYEVDDAKSRLERYLRPVQYPHERSFEEAYAAICVAKLYQEGDLAAEDVASYLRNGLQHELMQFCISCGEVRDGDDALFDTIWAGALERNGRWSSYPDLWGAVGRYRPLRLLSPEALEHVPLTSDSSIKGFLGALLEQRLKLCDVKHKAWPFMLRLMRERGRAVGWYAAFAAALLCPEQSEEFVKGDLVSDLDLRTALECALWLGEGSWVLALERSKTSRWRTIAEYAVELAAERERLRLADLYLETILGSGDRLRDWRYAQALLSLPSERALLRLSEWGIGSIQDGYLSNWLSKAITRASKKPREILFNNSRLPGEEAFPRWF